MGQVNYGGGRAPDGEIVKGFLISSWQARWTIGLALLVALLLLLAVIFWQDLHNGHITTIRDVGLVIGGITAMMLTVWRSSIAKRQADTAQLGLLNERYQKGAEMLGSEILSVRLAGIYALASLARDHPEQHHIQITELLCAFVRNPPEINAGQGTRDSQDNLPPLREDVQAAITAVGGRSKRGLSYEKAGDFRLNLYGASLKWARLTSSNLSGADLTRANVMHADLRCADLSRAILGGADLRDASLKGTDLSGAYIGPDFLPDPSGQLGDVEYMALTQDQLDEAKADSNNPPKLDSEAFDHATGKLLVWHGKPL